MVWVDDAFSHCWSFGKIYFFQTYWFLVEVWRIGAIFWFKYQYCSNWWFQIFFIFTPTFGNDPIWLIFFIWVETTNQLVVDVVSMFFSHLISCFIRRLWLFHGRCQGSQCRKIDHLVVVAECVAWAANELKRLFYNFGCFNRMIPDLYLGNGRFIQHPCSIQHPFQRMQNLQLVVSLVWNICNKNMQFQNLDFFLVQFILCGCVLCFFPRWFVHFFFLGGGATVPGSRSCSN